MILRPHLLRRLAHKAVAQLYLRWRGQVVSRWKSTNTGRHSERQLEPPQYFKTRPHGSRVNAAARDFQQLPSPHLLNKWRDLFTTHNAHRQMTGREKRDISYALMRRGQRHADGQSGLSAVDLNYCRGNVRKHKVLSQKFNCYSPCAHFEGPISSQWVDSVAMMRNLEHGVTHISRVNSLGLILIRFHLSKRALQGPLSAPAMATPYLCPLAVTAKTWLWRKQEAACNSCKQEQPQRNERRSGGRVSL